MEYFIKKSINILLEIILGNIKKERSKLKEPDKGNKQGLGVLKDPTIII